jgi:flavin reductase (NADH)
VDALAHLPLAVVVVAAAADGSRACSTATAGYVSYEPALLVTPLSSRSRTGALVRASGEFSITVLAADQAELAVRAAAPGSGDTFTDQRIDVLEPPPGHTAPGVAGGVATIWCKVESVFETAASMLVVGRAEAVVTGDGREPLLRFERHYHALGAPIEVAEEAAYPL